MLGHFRLWTVIVPSFILNATIPSLNFGLQHFDSFICAFLPSYEMYFIRFSLSSVSMCEGFFSSVSMPRTALILCFAFAETTKLSQLLEGLDVCEVNMYTTSPPFRSWLSFV